MAPGAGIIPEIWIVESCDDQYGVFSRFTRANHPFNAQEVPDVQLVSGDGGAFLVSMAGLAAVSPWVARSVMKSMNWLFA